MDFNPDDFMARVNSDLVGKYVNIASRAAGFLSKRFDGVVLPYRDLEAQGQELVKSIESGRIEIAAAYENREFGRAIRDIMRRADHANLYADQMKPWELAKNADAETLLHQTCSALMLAFEGLSRFLAPILPETTRLAGEMLGVRFTGWFEQPQALRINPYRHLAARVDAKQLDALFAVAESAPATAPAPSPASPAPPAPPKPAEGATIAAASATIGVEDFAKIDLRIAKIVNAEQVEGAEKLLKLTLDIGEARPRTVFAGIKAAYDPASLVGRHTVMVANLAPRKMKFGLSEGMVLAASDADGKTAGLYLLEPDAGAQPGMRVK